MDDWSTTAPSRNAVSEPAPNHTSPITTTPQPTARLSPPRQAPPPAPINPARPPALDPAGLARQHDNEVRGEAPKPLYPPTIRRSRHGQRSRTSKTANRPLTSPTPSWMTNVPPCERWISLRGPVVRTPPRCTSAASIASSRSPAAANSPTRLPANSATAARTRAPPGRFPKPSRGKRRDPAADAPMHAPHDTRCDEDRHSHTALDPRRRDRPVCHPRHAHRAVGRPARLSRLA